MVSQLATHAAGAGLLLHALQAIQHDQVRTTVAKSAFQTFQTTASRTFLFSQEQVVAFAEERVSLAVRRDAEERDTHRLKYISPSTPQPWIY